MKAQELRLKNIITKNGEEILVSPNDILSIYQCEKANAPIDYTPIPLTKEWLLKFGTEEIEWEHAPNYRLGRFEIEDLSGISQLNSDVCIRIRYDSEHSLLIAEIKYVHQLQNLYHALTGEELTIKQ